MNKRIKQSGYSLVEIMLGLAAASAISGGIWSTFQTATDTAQTYKSQVELIQQTSRMPMDPNACWLNPDGSIPSHCTPIQ